MLEFFCLVAYPQDRAAEALPLLHILYIFRTGILSAAGMAMVRIKRVLGLMNADTEHRWRKGGSDEGKRGRNVITFRRYEIQPREEMN